MNVRILLAVSVFLLCAAPTPVPSATTPVIVELFTSQGCSSCPPADRLLSELAADRSLRGKVIPLAYHVDYWNRLGWRDPFSAREWSARQYAYVSKMKLSSAYTPQVIVNGTHQMIGSNRASVLRAIDEESKRTVDGSLRLTFDGREASIDVRSPAPMQLIVVVVESGAVTEIPRGENSGLRLQNDAVVRRFYRLGEVQGNVQKSVALELDPSWNRSRLSVVAFLQDGRSLRIGAAATT